MELPPGLEFERLSDAQKYQRAVPGYMRRVRDLYEAMQDRFGEEGLELIREVSREYGERIARNVQRKGELEGIQAVGRYLLKVFDMVGGNCEVTELSGERLVICVHRCPYPFEREEICRAHTCMEAALVRTLDENLRHRVGRCIPSGDAVCEHIVELRDAAD